MLELKIIESKNLDLIGNWSYKKNEVCIGPIKNKISDIRLIEQDLGFDVTLVIHKEHLFFERVSHGDEDKGTSLINGKKTIGRSFLKIGDILTIGETKIEIVNFENSPAFVPQKFQNNLKKIIRGNHPINKIIKIIDDDLRKL